MKEEINNPFGILTVFLNNKGPNTKRDITIKKDTPIPTLVKKLCANTTDEEE
jgi:hypothetical protein